MDISELTEVIFYLASFTNASLVELKLIPSYEKLDVNSDKYCGDFVSILINSIKKAVEENKTGKRLEPEIILEYIERELNI